MCKDFQDINQKGFGVTDVVVKGDRHTCLSTQELLILIQNENHCRSKHGGWPVLMWCPGCKWQQVLQVSIWVYWQSCEGKFSFISLLNFCQYQFNARILNLPTFCMYLLDLNNGQTHFKPLTKRHDQCMCNKNKHTQQSNVCTSSIT